MGTRFHKYHPTQATPQIEVWHLSIGAMARKRRKQAILHEGVHSSRAAKEIASKEGQKQQQSDAKHFAGLFSRGFDIFL